MAETDKTQAAKAEAKKNEEEKRADGQEMDQRFAPPA